VTVTNKAKRKLLWIGDAVSQTGFARATHNTIDYLRPEWEVFVLGLNYFGDPHEYPYKIYPARNGGDLFGFGRVADLTRSLQPDLILVQNDPWNIPPYVEAVRSVRNVPIVAAVAVDGKNCRGRALSELSHVIFWTEFGAQEAIAGGFAGDYSVIPLGVDLNVYKPIDKLTARQAWNLPARLENAFIVGNVNQNQPRKRLDLTIAWFCEWFQRNKIDDAYLMLHVAPTGAAGYDCKQLMTYHGGAGRLIWGEVALGIGVEEADMVNTYNAFDVQVTTTQGEGFGLTTLEGMACGIPQIVPKWEALGEWATAAMQVDCSEIAATIGMPSNAIGAVANRAQWQHALSRLYRLPELREQLRDAGLKLAAEDRFRWHNIGQRFAQVLDKVESDAKAA
jgi:D-inositol-3-phosphate glycosyltransferase